ncbi:MULTISPECIES: FAD-dependent oxidoreductase [unclassified Adlercreutzia]|uniref:FAD-dependent oxidoreductase n=1 Tax=unclassified Adlercreutzia TaxID=2636013 RepID=UPI0013EAF2DA|nr:MULTISPECIES: FAD-dependent oxidoreductase [unclassified Adlercreutzia]
MADFDAIVVGAGCAGSVAAVKLARAGKSVLLIDRAGEPGSKNMTGGRIYAHALAKVLPDFADEAPLERKITRERVSFLTDADNTTLEFASPSLGLPENASYAVLRAPFDAWLADQAEQAGAECVFGITVEDLVMDGGRVCGVRAGDDEITAEVTILADGANSLLSERAGLAKRPLPHQMAVSAKEVIELPEGVISDRFQVPEGEGCAWLFVGAATQGHAGGGFLYTNRTSVSIGVVATLSDLCGSSTPVYKMLDAFKEHPAVAPVLAGGKLVEYSAHMVPEGGLAMVPKLACDGCLLAGDAAMLCVNLGYQVRGMDYAMASGAAAAQAAVAAIDAGDTSEQGLAGYREALEDCFVLQDLRDHAGLPAFLEQTPRLYGEYPAMAAEVMRGMFAVDGSPVGRLRDKVRPAVRRVGLRNILKDVRRGVKAL